MDESNTVYIDHWEKVYENKGYWIAKNSIGSYYIITTDQRAAANQIAVLVRPYEFEEIMKNNGDWKLVSRIISGRGFLYASYRDKEYPENQ